jgi:hypothetical protein
VCLGVAWCHQTGTRRAHWKVRIKRRPQQGIALVITMEQSNEGIRDNFLLPAAELAQTTVGKLTIANRRFEDRQHDNLSVFYEEKIAA